MFKLLSVIKPAEAKAPAMNHFNCYCVAMPARLTAVLQKRVYTVLLHKYYGVTILHDLTNNHLIELDDFLLSNLSNDAHNLIVDSLQLEHLKRFLKAERIIASSAKIQLVPSLTNTEYWILAGELLAELIRPTKLVPLSLFP